MKNILLQGGSGTGKTITARAMTYYLGCKGQKPETIFKNDYWQDINDIENFVQSEYVEYIQIHPSMTYEDVVYGIEVKPGGNLTMEYAEKRIKTICDRAAGRTEDFFVILDDIGRTNPGRLLGNLLYALEYRNQAVVLADGTQLVVPENVYFIITECKMMYGKPLEYAIRRRFDYEKELTADWDVLDRYYSFALQPQIVGVIKNVFETIENFVNDHIINDNSVQRENYIPGHGMLMVDRGGSANDILVKIKQKFEYQVFPYLTDMKMSGIIMATDADMQNFKDKVKNELNAGQISGGNNASVQKVFYKKGQPIPVFNITDSYDYYVNSIIPNDCKEHRTIIECIVDAIFLNGIFSVDKALSDILLNTNIVKFEHRNSPGTYAAFLAESTQNMNYGYLTTVSKNVRSYYSSNPCKTGRWGNDKDSPAYKVTLSNGSSKTYISLNAFRNTGFDTSEKVIHAHENTASIYCALYHLVHAYLTAYESGLLLMTVNDPSYMDIYRLVGLERKYWELKNIESQDIKGADSKLINLAKSVIDLKTLWGNEGTNIAVDSGKLNALVSGTTRLSVASYEDLYNITGTSKTIVREGVKTMIDVNDYQKIMEGTGVRQMIFQGPPGTSKTFESKKFVLKQLDPGSSALTKANPTQEDISNSLEGYKLTTDDYANPQTSSKLTTGGWDLVQFHPSYGYEDFIRGIDVKPVNGQPVYESVNRLLGKIAEFAKLAEKSAAKGENAPKFYLIIDEINRANLATVFGELIYGLEYRNSKVSTPYEVNDRVENGISKDIVLAKNLFIIGTMNTADKSIDAIDYAIRRRFIFVDSPAKRTVVKACYQSVMGIQDETDENSIELLLFDAVTRLFDDNRFFNDEYQRSDVKLGHTYFLRNSSKDYLDTMENKFVFQVIPILREYIKDGILDSYEEKSKLEHSVHDIASSTAEKRVDMLSEEVMLIIKCFGEMDSSGNIIDNQYAAKYIDDLCKQLGWNK